MKLILTLTCFLITVLSCSKHDKTNSAEASHTHIEYYGFTIVDTYWDDPTDSEAKTNYADEIQHFSNIADILVVTPSDNIVHRVQHFTSMGLKTILHLNELFFEQVDGNSPSGSNYDLRADFKERWNEFKRNNASILSLDYLGAFYIGEEPTWNGITYTEMNAVAELLDSEYESVPTMVIEAYPALEDWQVPQTVDWIGFDRYFVKNPLNDVEFQQNWRTLKSKLSNSNQKIMVILDSHYIDWAHGDFGNINLEQMDEVASNYYDLAIVKIVKNN